MDPRSSCVSQDSRSFGASASSRAFRERRRRAPCAAAQPLPAKQFHRAPLQLARSVSMVPGRSQSGLWCSSPVRIGRAAHLEQRRIVSRRTLAWTDLRRTRTLHFSLSRARSRLSAARAPRKIFLIRRGCPRGRRRLQRRNSVSLIERARGRPRKKHYSSVAKPRYHDCVGVVTGRSIRSHSHHGARRRARDRPSRSTKPHL